MQMTMEQTARPGFLLAFASRRGSGYVLRSEKRPGYGGGGSPNRGGRGPRKPPRAGILYILLTLLISIIIWPVGLVMLWSRKVRMQAGTKLLISLLTLCVSVFLIVFTLTVPVDNPKFTAFQDKANDWLNRAAANVAVAGDAAYKKGVETWGVMSEFSNNAISPVANSIADGIDRGVALASAVRAKFDHGQGVDVPRESTVPDETPSATEASEEGSEETINILIPENTPDPDTAQPLSSGLLTSNDGFRPDETPEPTEAPSEDVVEVVEKTMVDSDDAEQKQTEVSDEDGEPLAWTAADEVTPSPTEAAESKDGTDENVTTESESSVETTEDEADQTPVEDTAATTDTAEPEPSETPVPELEVKPAGEATVYYNTTGRLYHLRSSCKNMRSAPAHTLAEAVEGGKVKCNTCGSPDASVLDIEHIAWVDEENVFHITDECPEFKGQWMLISLNSAIAGDYRACEDCGANVYAELYGEPDVTPEPTEEPTEAPDEEPTPEPSEEPAETPTVEPTVVTPSVTLKPVGDITVYHSSNGKFYHRQRVCKAMTGSQPYKLSEITAKYKRCKTCDAPDVALVGETCLYMDKDGLCHTADTCEKFNGDYTLILRDDALSQGLTGCPDCGADEYLIPGTVLAGE